MGNGGKRGRSILGVSVILLLSLAAAGCSEGLGQLNQMKDQVSATVTELKEAAGKSVASLEQVNGALVKSGAGVIGILKELNLDISYQENGVAFKNAKGLSGLLSVQGNQLVVDVTSESTDAETVKTILRIANAFSPSQLLEQRLESFTGKAQAQETQLENGYIRSDGKKLELRLTAPLL